MSFLSLSVYAKLAALDGVPFWVCTQTNTLGIPARISHQEFELPRVEEVGLLPSVYQAVSFSLDLSVSPLFSRVVLDIVRSSNAHVGWLCASLGSFHPPGGRTVRPREDLSLDGTLPAFGT